jgi:hypothetical protein
MKTSVRKLRRSHTVDDWMGWLNVKQKLNLPTLSSPDHDWPDFLVRLWQMETGHAPDAKGQLPRGKIPIKKRLAFRFAGTRTITLSALALEISLGKKPKSNPKRPSLKAASTGVAVSLSGKLVYASRAGKISVTVDEAIVDSAGNWRLQLPPTTLSVFWSQLTTSFSGIANVPPLPTDDIWSFLGAASVTPIVSIPLQPASAYFELKFNQPPTIPASGKPWTFEPSIEIDALMISYDPGLGFDFKTRIKINLASATNTPSQKVETVGFPPNLPVPPNPILTVNYLGLGQHIGPPVTPPDPTLTDPLKAIFQNIESQFQGADPQSIITALATKFYGPNRDWLVAADFTLLTTFNFRVLFNDPDFYGLEITVNGGLLKGFLFEILYQKIGPSLGLYFGALDLPDNFRRVELDGFVLILPGFSIWIYTDGDFKVAVGWPVNSNSIGVQIGPLIGWAGFYFAKLRGADLPHGALSNYNLILELGFGVDITFDGSIDIGILSGGWHIGVGGSFQGVIAWHDGSTTLNSTAPELYWFAGTANVAIVVWGEVNFGVVQASVGINLGAGVSIAFQTGCQTVLAVSAQVSAYAKVKVGFFSVSFNFHTQLSHSFSIGSGPAAVPSGPVQQRINARALALPKPRRALAAPAKHKAKRRRSRVTPIDVYFALQPTVVYSAPNTSEVNVIASLVVPCPATSADTGTGFQTIVEGLIDWMVSSFGGASGPAIQQLQNIKQALGPAAGEPTGGMAGFVGQIKNYLQNNVPIRILPAPTGPGSSSVAVLPMLDVLVLDAGGQTIDFSSYHQVPDDYTTIVNDYFKDLRNLGSGNPSASQARAAPRSRTANWTVASWVFGDYFLMICRHVVGELIGAANQNPQLALSDLIAQLDYASVAGLASRFLSFGLRLPSPPAIPPTDPVDNTSGLYQLTGQQFAVAGAATASATLSALPSAQGWISFGPDGTSPNVTSQISGLSPVPLMPNTAWLGQVTALPPLISRPATVALAKTKTVIWTAATGNQQTLYPLPLPLDARAKSMQLSSAPPEAGSRAPVPGIPALLIRLSVSEVKNRTGAGAGTAATDNVPFVYQLNATDEATRDLIYAAINQGSFTGASVTLLYTGGTPPGLLSDDLDDATLLAKNNLSVENQAPAVSAILAQRLEALEPSPVSATLKDPVNFLKLVWEVSVVNAPGFLLFYQTKSRTGQPPRGLPPSIFEQSANGTPVTGSGGRTAEFDILVQFGSTPSPSIPLQPFVNCVVVQGQPATLYATLFDQAVAPLQAYVPAYPPGNIGFQLQRPPITTPSEDPIPVDDLYHLAQYAVTGSTDFNGSEWSLAVAPTGVGSDKGTVPWSYQRIVPITRFVTPPANPMQYSAIGKTASLSFRLVDIYGDALPTTTSANFFCYYNDPLISPAAWPGTDASYQFSAAGGSARRRRAASPAAALSITINFDLDKVKPPATIALGDVAAYWASIRARFELALAQLQDSNATVSATTSLVTSGPLAGPDDPRQKLIDFINNVLGILPKFFPTTRRNATVTTTSTTINLVVPFAEIGKLPDDINPLIVSLTLSRPGSLVNPPSMQPAPSDQLPSLLSVNYAIPPDVSQATVAQFAKNFEDVFANFDGKATALKLAQLASVAGTMAVEAAATPFWAIRYSETGSNPNAINVAFQGPDKINYFAARPLSLQPYSGQAPNQKLYSKIDLDVWAEQFLRAFDDFVSPQMAVAISILDARNDTTYYSDLMACKSDLATAIANGVERIFSGNPAPAPDQPLNEAIASFRQALLVQLSSAFTISTIVQVPATVQTTTPQVPRLFGRLGAPPPPQGTAPTLTPPYALSSAEIEVAPGAQCLTSLFTVTQDLTDQAYIQLPLQYQPSFLQRDLDESDTIDGYVPSSWLRFVNPLDPLVCGTPSIPVPLPFLPQAPSLVVQTASAHNAAPVGTSIGDEIRNALEWDYTVTLAASQLAAQDELHFTITYNVANERLRSTGATPIDALFDALATFQENNPLAAADVQAILTEAYGSGVTFSTSSSAQQVIQGFLGRAQAISQAWSNIWTQRVTAAASDELEDEFYFEYTFDKTTTTLTLSLFGRSVSGTPGAPSQWPASIQFGLGGPQTIQDPKPADNGYYTVDVLTIALGSTSLKQFFSSIIVNWQAFELLGSPAIQSATFEAWVIRNANLSPTGAAVNPDFKYESQHARFGTAAIPIIELNSLPAIVPSTLKLSEVLQQILAPLNSGGQSPIINLECSYVYELVADSSGLGPSVSWPVFELMAVQVPNDVTPLVDQITAWHTLTTPPAGKSASLNIALTLFSTVGGSQMPVVEIHDIPIDVSAVPPSWWQSQLRPARRAR